MNFDDQQLVALNGELLFIFERLKAKVRVTCVKYRQEYVASAEVDVFIPFRRFVCPACVLDGAGVKYFRLIATQNRNTDAVSE